MKFGIEGKGGRVGIVKLGGVHIGKGGRLGIVILGGLHDGRGGNVKLGGVN